MHLAKHLSPSGCSAAQKCHESKPHSGPDEADAQTCGGDRKQGQQQPLNVCLETPEEDICLDFRGKKIVCFLLSFFRRQNEKKTF